MKTYLLAIAIAFGTLFGLSAQAAPVVSDFAALKSQAGSMDSVQKVWHCRRWSGGWGCGWGPFGILPGWGYGWRHHRWRHYHR